MAICGLDFGTTNSTFSYLGVDGQVQLVPLEQGKETLPTAVFFNFEEGEAFYGREALEQYVEGEFGRLMRALKSVLGTSLMADKTQVQGKLVAFEDIIARFLKEMKTRAEQHTQQVFDSVVLGRPVHFIDDDKTADQQAEDTLRQAAIKAGFEHIEFQYEPIAAALDYEQSTQQEELALIVDLGGGTSDFSVVRVSPAGQQKVDRREDILATGGVHIGGVDFDRRLSLHTVMPELGYRMPFKDNAGQEFPVYYHQNLATWHKIHFLYDKETEISLRSMLNQVSHKALLERLLTVVENREGHRVAIAVENAKITLTEQDNHVDSFDFIEKGLTIDFEKSTLNSAIEDDVERVCQAALATLKRAGVEKAAIDKVFMTGGSTSIPYIRQSILALFPEAEVVDGHTFGSVGTGLCLHAKRVFA
tara:strand:+ start:1152 stop:2408 length:1257 start_codon:yes stop_codon:yes gene_type:complete